MLIATRLHERLGKSLMRNWHATKSDFKIPQDQAASHLVLRSIMHFISDEIIVRPAKECIGRQI